MRLRPDGTPTSVAIVAAKPQAGRRGMAPADRGDPPRRLASVRTNRSAVSPACDRSRRSGAPSGFRGHGPEGYRVALHFDGRDAVFPDLPRRPRHHVDRTWPSLERETLPPGVGGPAKPELARRAQRQAEHPVEVRLVPVPADADTDVALGAKDLTNSAASAAKASTFSMIDPSHSGIGSASSSRRTV
jgi:hypothetical protein